MSHNGYFGYDLKLRESTVIDNREIAPDVFLLSLPRYTKFLAGQVIGLSLDPSEEPRLYSICSGIGQDELQILYNIKQDGYFTPKLRKAKWNDKIWISDPFGSFLGSEEPAYWIASGTGIAPFLSMFLSVIGGNKVLIHGGRTLDSFYFADELISFFRENYVRCCSQETSSEVFSGRLKSYLRQLSDLPTDQNYYLCGLAEMIVESRDILISKGVPFDNILAEIYF